MNPFESRFVRPDQNVYRFAAEPTLQQSRSESFREQLLHRLAECRRAALIGPHGTGKTTLLHSSLPALQEVYDQVVMQTLSSDRRTSYRQLHQELPPATHAPHQRVCWIVDGYEQLPPVSRLQLLHRMSRRPRWALLVTGHRAFWTIPTVFQTGWDDAVAKSLLEEKIACLPHSEREQLWSWFYQRCASGDRGCDNLRDVWFDLYDLYEQHKPLKETAP